MPACSTSHTRCNLVHHQDHRTRQVVCVAPEFVHSAFTPPGSELPSLRITAGSTLVEVALGPGERVVEALLPVPMLGPDLAGEVV